MQKSADRDLQELLPSDEYPNRDETCAQWNEELQLIAQRAEGL